MGTALLFRAACIVVDPACVGRGQPDMNKHSYFLKKNSQMKVFLLRKKMRMEESWPIGQYGAVSP